MGDVKAFIMGFACGIIATVAFCLWRYLHSDEQSDRDLVRNLEEGTERTGRITEGIAGAEERAERIEDRIRDASSSIAASIELIERIKQDQEKNSNS